MKFLLSVLCVVIFSLNSFAQDINQHPAQLLSGPMVGHTTTSEANIWVETDKPAEVKFTIGLNTVPVRSKKMLL